MGSEVGVVARLRCRGVAKASRRLPVVRWRRKLASPSRKIAIAPSDLSDHEVRDWVTENWSTKWDLSFTGSRIEDERTENLAATQSQNSLATRGDANDNDGGDPALVDVRSERERLTAVTVRPASFEFPHARSKEREPPSR